MSGQFSREIAERWLRSQDRIALTREEWSRLGAVEDRLHHVTSENKRLREQLAEAHERATRLGERATAALLTAEREIERLRKPRVLWGNEVLDLPDGSVVQRVSAVVTVTPEVISAPIRKPEMFPSTIRWRVLYDATS